MSLKIQYYTFLGDLLDHQFCIDGLTLSEGGVVDHYKSGVGLLTVGMNRHLQISHLVFDFRRKFPYAYHLIVWLATFIFPKR